MDAFIPALIGLFGVFLGAYLSSRSTRAHAADQRVSELTAQAFRDLMVAIARNAHALAAFDDAQTPDRLDHFEASVVESRMDVAAAKALLGTYASGEVVHHLRMADDGGFSSVEAHAALVTIATLIRREMRPDDWETVADDLNALLYGG